MTLRNRSRVGRRALALVVTAATLAGGAQVSAVGDDDAPAPSQWPSAGLDLRLDGWPHALRLAGADRYQTSLVTALTLRGAGDFPYDTPDPSSAGAANLAAAGDWWGPGVCPRSIIVVAGDRPADALAASALSDPSGNSSEPVLTRSAAADPLFNPIGGTARIDTDHAPIVITDSARRGATNLSAAARIAAQDLRAGGCTDAFQAVVVGGTAAVPAAVDQELVTLGYDEVFRVSGADRYATAAAIAAALGTAGVTGAPAGTTPACSDPAVDDGDARLAFRGNSVVEYRETATTCRVLARTVVLTDGVTGADALAAGWWTSTFQVPVLLHDGSSALPPATADALRSIDAATGIDHVIVLGGTGRLPEAVAAEAAATATADVVRVAGTDRYATSVLMAERFGGWYPTQRADEFEGSMVCLVASSGSAATAAGWPDALGAGPWCGALGGLANAVGAPERALAPVTGQSPTTSARRPLRPAHDAVPVLLVPAGATTLPGSVRDLLAGAFEPAADWCTSVNASASCRVPGFAVAFGGETLLPAALLDEVSTIVSGGSSGSGGAVTPVLADPFHTRLDLTPVYAAGGAASPTDRICAARDSYRDARWLAVFDDARRLVESSDVMFDLRYQRDGDGTVRSRRTGAPVCVGFDAGTTASVSARPIGLSGRAGSVHPFDLASASRLDMLGTIATASVGATSGLAADVDPATGGASEWTWSSGAPGVSVKSSSVTLALTNTAVTVRLERGIDSGGITAPDTFTATFSITTDLGVVTGTATGEAVWRAGGWELAGSSTFTGGTWNVSSGRGGFRASISANAIGTANDDAIIWQVDGIVSAPSVAP